MTLRETIFFIAGGCFEPLLIVSILLGVPWSFVKLRERRCRAAIIGGWCVALVMLSIRVMLAGAAKRYSYMLVFVCVTVTALALKDMLCAKRWQPFLRIVAASICVALAVYSIGKCFRFNPYESSIRDGCRVISQMAGDKKFPLVIVSDKEIDRVGYYAGVDCITDKVLDSSQPIDAKLSLLHRHYSSVADIVFVVLKSPVNEWGTPAALPYGAKIVFQKYVDKKKKKYFTVIAMQTDRRRFETSVRDSLGDRAKVVFAPSFEAGGAQQVKPFLDNFRKRGLVYFYYRADTWPIGWSPFIPGEILFSGKSEAEVEVVDFGDGGGRALRMRSGSDIGLQNMAVVDFHENAKIMIVADGKPGTRFEVYAVDINSKYMICGVRPLGIFLISTGGREEFSCLVPASANRFRIAIKLLHGEIMIRDIKVVSATDGSNRTAGHR